MAGGLLAAVFWGTSAVAAARAARRLGAGTTLAWVQVVGLLIILPIVAARGIPETDASAIGWVALSAPTAVIAIYLMYLALRQASVSLVMPLVAMQGAVAAVLTVALGETLGVVGTVGLVAAVLGTYGVIRWQGSSDRQARAPSAAILLATGCALIGGLSLYSAARAGADLGAAWLLASYRVFGVLCFTIPVAMAGRLTRPIGVGPLIVFCALADLGGFASYIIASTNGSVAVAAVLSSQFATVSVLVGVFKLGERLSTAQMVAVATVLAGVGLMTAAQV